MSSFCCLWRFLSDHKKDACGEVGLQQTPTQWKMASMRPKPLQRLNGLIHRNPSIYFMTPNNIYDDKWNQIFVSMLPRAEITPANDFWLTEHFLKCCGSRNDFLLGHPICKLFCMLKRHFCSTFINFLTTIFSFRGISKFVTGRSDNLLH